MSTPPENELDLDKLFLPAWAQEPASANLYAKYEGGEDRGRRDERRGPRPPGRGPRPQREGGRDARPGGSGGRRPDGREGRPQHGGERGPGRPMGGRGPD